MSLRKSSSRRNGSKSDVLPKPNARRRCTPAPSRVGLALISRLMGRIDMLVSQVQRKKTSCCSVHSVEWLSPRYASGAKRQGGISHSRRVDSRKSGIVAADVRRLTWKKTNGTEPPYVGCYGFSNRPCLRSVQKQLCLVF